MLVKYVCPTSLCGAAAADRTEPQDVLKQKHAAVRDILLPQKREQYRSSLVHHPLTFVFEVLQDGDDGFQRDAVSQEQLPGAVLLKGLPVQRLNCGHKTLRHQLLSNSNTMFLDSDSVSH